MEVIDSILNFLAHPFFMVLFGITSWFALKWSIQINKKEKKPFWSDQKDEIIVTLIFGLLFLIWDDEVIQMYYDIRGLEGHPELKPYYYLLVGPAIERLYKIYEKYHS